MFGENTTELALKGFCQVIGKSSFEFSCSEIIAYYKICGVSLTEKETDKLYAYTEGWVSALYLSLLNLAQEQKIDLQSTLSELIEKTVYRPYPQPVKDFLLTLCIFDSFSLKQAEAMWPITPVTPLLQYLMKHNAFIRYDHYNQTYHIHNILGLYLREQLALQGEARWRELQELAAQWYMQNEEYISAMECFYQARDFDKLLTAFEKDNGHNTTPERKQRILQYFSECPAEIRRNHPIAALIYARKLFLLNETELYPLECKKVGEDIQEIVDEKIKKHFQGELELIKSFSRYNDLQGMIDHQTRAYELLQGPSRFFDHRNFFTFGTPSVLYMFYRQRGAAQQTADLLTKFMPRYCRITENHDGIGVSPNLLANGLACQDGPLHKVYESGEIYQAADIWWESVLEPEAEEPVLTSMLLVPLKQGRQVKGILAAAWKPAGKVIVQEDAEILRQFADLAFFAMDRLQTQVRIQHMAYYDVLTELPNRAHLNQRIERELESARSGEAAGTLLFIDIDDFKAVNDTFGHSAGDKVIVDAASSLQQSFSEEAEVFRISGDEFIVLAPGRKTKSQAAALAEVACKALSREYNVAGETIHLSASIGVVCYPQQADWPEELLKMADAAMYAAKAAGRNCWRFFEPALLQKTADDMMMLNALRRALVRNEFFLVYQPQFTTDGRRISGFEALLRWDSEEYGLVAPSSFIPLAERSSLIIEIGQWVLQESCRFAAQLAENGWGDVHIAANISTRQMRSEDFVSLVKENVEKYALQPAQLELEITESILMENMTEGITKLRELHAYGCRLALDDFGTGFSSLTYLRNLPVDCLKIDKTFIDTIALDTLQKKMVCSIIGLGHTLGMEVVAEGAEEQRQVDCLLECSCDYVQGYVFSRPVAQAAAIKLLQKTRWSSAETRE